MVPANIFEKGIVKNSILSRIYWQKGSCSRILHALGAASVANIYMSNF